jgi:YbbR domain-containing protein
MIDFLQRYVFAHFGYKVISLALAIGLWWAVSHDPVAEVEVTVPIEFHRIPTNLEIHEIRPQEVHVELDLAGVKPGERTFDLTSQHVGLPRDVEVVQVVPSQVRLSFDIGASKQVPVRPRVIGTFAPGFRIAKVSAEPAEVTIGGPKQRVEAVEAATTDPVDASGNMDRGMFVTNAFVPDPLVQIVRPMPVRVTVVMERVGAEPAGNKPSE